jgi:hypothetical protein
VEDNSALDPTSHSSERDDGLSAASEDDVMSTSGFDA